MRRTKVSIPWEAGLHLRPAATIVKMTRQFRSRVQLRLGDKIADAGNILTIVMLAASFGTALDVEASGPDEQEAIAAVVSIFEMVDMDQAVDSSEADEGPEEVR